MEDNSHLKEDIEKENKTETAIESENASPDPGQPATPSVENEENKVKEELAAAKDKYIRLYSEFENFRRRTAKEKLEMIQSANEQLIKALLPVIDDFERAEKAFNENSDKNAEGFLLIAAKFKKVLEIYGVKTMDIKQGSDFDSDVHEAITQIPADPDLKGKIVEVVEKGYLINDKVIRFAKVVVGS